MQNFATLSVLAGLGPCQTAGMLRFMKCLCVLGVLGLLLACGGESRVACGSGGREIGAVCAYAVVEGGFDCPAHLPMEFGFGGEGRICAPSGTSLESIPDDACIELGQMSCAGLEAQGRPDAGPLPIADGGDNDTGADCSAPRMLCGDRCIDPTSDSFNCGSCGAVCADSVCVNGQCDGTCASGLVACGVRCVDLETDRAHCGACDQACRSSQTCASGICVASESMCGAPVHYDAELCGVAPDVGFCILDANLADAMSQVAELRCDTALPSCDEGSTSCRFGSRGVCDGMTVARYNDVICTLYGAGYTTLVREIPLD